MVMRRFLYDGTVSREGIAELSSAESHHVKRVLRLKLGEKIELFDGGNTIMTGEIVHLQENVKVKIESRRNDAETQSGLCICQALIKPKKMELIIQKCTELGVDVIRPYFASRSQGNLRRQCQGKGDRWLRIMEDACKQSQRTLPMEVAEPVSFDALVGASVPGQEALKLLFWEQEQSRTLGRLTRDLAVTREVVLMFGPEGGYTADEIEAAREQGWMTVSLGTKILRAETAVISATAIVQHYRSNM